MGTHQVPEAALNHELESLGRAGRVSSDHRSTRHDRTDRSSTRIQSLRRNLRIHASKFSK